MGFAENAKKRAAEAKTGDEWRKVIRAATKASKRHGKKGKAQVAHLKEDFEAWSKKNEGDEGESEKDEKDEKKSSSGSDSDSDSKSPPKIARQTWLDEMKHTMAALAAEQAASESRSGGVCVWEQRLAVRILRAQADKLAHLT